MKKWLFAFFFVFANMTYSWCQQTHTLPFKLEGHVTGINGKKITLDIPIYATDKRLTTIVNNDTFFFQGLLSDSIVFARILLDEDITNPTGGYMSFPLMVSNGLTKVRFKATKTNDPVIRYHFKDLAIEQGDAGIEYNKFHSLINKEVFQGMSYKSDSLYLDSMNRFVLPTRRQLFEKLYTRYKDSIQYAYNKVKLLITFSQTDLYNARTPFLTDIEKNFILSSYQALVPKLIHHTEFNYINSYFSNYGIEKKIKFTDFELVTTDNRKIRLSSIIKSNKYTVLYFWWSGCIPCRQFHRKEKSTYPMLRSKNIEFISINTDDIKFKWKEASKKDNIGWLNLFAGRFSPIIPTYDIQIFPTKIVVNNKMEIIPFSFNSMKDLLLLAQ